MQLSRCSLTTLSVNRFVYYLSKYWELLDSLFQLQKARSLGSSPPGFLHYFHHAAVMVLLLVICFAITTENLLEMSHAIASGHVLELAGVQPVAAVAWPCFQHFRPCHHVRLLALLPVSLFLQLRTTFAWCLHRVDAYV